MIYLKEKLIFIHIPKTGGTSIENIWVNDPEFAAARRPHKFLLKKYKEQNKYPDVIFPNTVHHSLKWAKKWIKDNNYNYSDFTSFTIVRNIWEMIRSYYLYKARNDSHFAKNKTFKEHVDNFLKYKKQFLVKNEEILNNIDQYDYVLMQENLNDDFNSMCGNLELNHLIGKLQVCNKTMEDKTHLHFKRAQVEYLQYLFDDYFEKFKYPKDPKNN